MSERLTHLWDRYERRENAEMEMEDDNLTIDEICELIDLQHAEIETLLSERQVARAVARRLLDGSVHGGDSREWWIERHPWLKEGE